MKVFKNIIGIALSGLVIFSCKQLYNPPAITSNTNYLVVDGIINTGNDSTIIKLSRTVSLNNKTGTKTEAKAVVTVESDANSSYPLTEIKTGTYISTPLNLNKTAKYRLRIVTADHKTYLSDFTGVKESPVIDSLTYKTPSSGLQININTHDVTNNTRYYRWEYAETWAFHSLYSSSYIAKGTQIVSRTADQNIFDCWGNDASADIILGSSAKLTQDVIFNTPIALVPSSSEKLRLGYSILVKQYALTEDAFNFWQILKKNTEQLGSIFDAQPSIVKGNIHNINDSSEPVFGYISAGTVQQKRITLFYPSFPQGWGLDNSAYNNCLLDTVLKKDYGDYYFGGGAIWIPIASIVVYPPIPGAPPDTVGYLGSGRTCVDCTLRGTNKKPAFWP